MKTITPRNAVEALRLARTWERAQALRDAGYTFWLEADMDSVAVCKPGKLSAAYWIDVKDETCECGDFQKRGDYCKHLLCWGIIEEERAMWEAKCGEIEKMLNDCELESCGTDPYARY